MITIADIIDTLSNNHILWRTLRRVEVPLAGGRPRYAVGNAAVGLHVRCDGRDAWLKCYTRPNDNLPAIYGTAFHPQELCVFGMGGRRQWVDCLVCEYVAGQTLDTLLYDTDAHKAVSVAASAFDRAALGLLHSERAHGDLKPENMILTPDGEMKFIDWDAAYVPALAGRTAPETGTAAYQHPKRTTQMYDKHIDDYSIALLSVMLHAAALDPDVTARYRSLREFPLHPRRIAAGYCEELEHTADLFASRGMAPQYRLTRMLSSPTPYLFDLECVMDAACRAQGATVTTDTAASEPSDAMPELDERDGLWGYRTGGQWIIPPLYDWGFDPTEGVMLVGLGGYSHFILRDGSVAATFGRGCTVKPLRDGRTVVRRADGSCRTLEMSSIWGRRVD